jgi:hypothetical protein
LKGPGSGLTGAMDPADRRTAAAALLRAKILSVIAETRRAEKVGAPAPASPKAPERGAPAAATGPGPGVPPAR